MAATTWEVVGDSKLAGNGDSVIAQFVRLSIGWPGSGKRFTYERAPELRVLRVSFCAIRHSLLPKRFTSVLFSQSYVRSGPRGA